MSLDMFTESTPLQLPRTPMKVPRTPPMTPSRSGRRRTGGQMSSQVSKKDPRCCSQPVRREDFYDLRTRQVPLTDRELWLQYGIKATKHQVKTTESLEDLQEDLTNFTTKKQERRSWKDKVSNFTKGLKMFSMMIFSAFLGAACYAGLQNNFLFIGDYDCPPQIAQSVQLDRTEESTIHPFHLEDSVSRLAEEVQHLKKRYDKMQENVGSEVVSRPQKGILEELLVADLASAGNLGAVLATPDTETYTVPATVTLLWFLSFRVQVNHRSPHTTIEGLIQEVGDCWPFHGNRGRLLLKLHSRSIVTGVSLSHIPSALSVSGDISSAPRIFQVLVHQQDEADLDHGLILGEFEYETSGSWRQTFAVEPSVKKEPVDIVEFRFLKNHGHPNYTCVYRVHVHGTTL